MWFSQRVQISETSKPTHVDRVPSEIHSALAWLLGYEPLVQGRKAHRHPTEHPKIIVAPQSKIAALHSKAPTTSST